MLGGNGCSALEAATVVGADWPQFLGSTRNGVYAGGDIASSFPKEGPPVRWQKKVGQGFSGPAVWGGKLLLFDRVDEKERVQCLDVADGNRLWEFTYPTSYRDDFGFDEGPRATPSVVGQRVYTFGAEGALTCLDLQNGRKLWAVDARRQFQAGKGFFGMACSPLVVDSRVVLNLGGTDRAGVVAFDAENGKLLWKATDEEASYSSPVSTSFGGKPRILCFARGGLFALDLEDGHVQARFPWRSRSHASVNAATPLVFGDLVFVSASYETGAALLRLGADKFETLWSSDDVLSNHYSTSVEWGGFLFGFHGRQEFGPSLRCVELRSGKLAWSKDQFGAGTLLVAGDRLLVLKEDGELILLAASPRKYDELGRAQILPKTVRAYPALANGCLYARSTDRLVCVDLRAR